MPEVSVIIPTHNRLPLLRKAVDSVLAQTFEDLELIVVDDGSTDATRDYLESIADTRVRSIGLERCANPTCARSAGLRHARGAWVAFLDSDDLWLPEKLALQLRRLSEHPRDRWSYTGYLLVDANENPLTERSARLHPPVSGRILARLLGFELGVSIVTVLAQRSLIDEIGGFDDSIPIRGDYDFTLRLAARSNARAVPENLALVREHAQRTTSRIRRADLHTVHERIFRKAAATAGNRRIRNLCLRQCAVQIAEHAGALSREGSHAAAFAALARAARIRTFNGTFWRTVAGNIARALGWRRTARHQERIHTS